MRSKNVFVTGGAGYIGSILVEDLLNEGHKVTILDNFKFGVKSLKETINHPNLVVIIEDMTMIKSYSKYLKGVDTIIHLGGIVGDPACATNAAQAINSNVTATQNIVDGALEAKVKHLIFASTCSVYGANNNVDLLTEESELNPVSLYAETKIKGEKILKEAQTNGLITTTLRLGTIFGLSYRPRFDLIINFLTGKIQNEGKASIFGGDQWRPFVSVKDIANAFKIVMEAEMVKVKNEIFNIGFNEQNLQLIDLKKIFETIFLNCKIEVDDKIIDNRSYKVSFDKFTNRFEFNSTLTITEGISEIKQALESKKILNYYDHIYYNYRPN